MESTRAVKRRKLDTPDKKGNKSSPAGQSSAKSAKTSDKKAWRGRDANTLGSSTGPTPAASNDWTQAKARAQERIGKRVVSTPQQTSGVDVYEDYDGAHSGKSRLQPLANSTPKAKQLDPLRNQVASSPAKSNAGLDLFKRFTKPRDQDEVLKSRERAASAASGTQHHTAPAKDTTSAKAQAVHQSAPATQNGKGAWKTWAYADSPKKTFEDEIHEIARAAEENANNRDEGGNTDRSALRRRGRNSSTPADARHGADAGANARFMPVITPKTAAKTIGRPKKAAEPSAVVKIPPEAKEDDKIDVDVENELELQIQSEASTRPPATSSLKEKLSKPAKKTMSTVPKIRIEADELQLVQSILLEQLAGRRPVKLTNLDDEHAKVSIVIEQAVTAGESNSMLLIGSRGCGKTALVNDILRQQAIEHPDDFHVVRLNGFIHTDDKIALREIWRQLGREMDLDEEESNLKNYADTLTSLLALLSHPAEQGREQQQGQVTKSVIFILDEFELFASHPRQTLLYNLFDIAQSRKAPITVLGLTTKIDVAESLEKRVKSRFSHRYVYLSSAKSLHAFQEACKAALTIQADTMSAEEKKHLINGRSSVVDRWTSCLDALLAQEEVQARIRHIYYTTKSVPEFQSSMLLSFSTLATDEATNAAELLEHLIPTTVLSAPDSKLSQLEGLSTLHLALLICAARLTAIHGQDTIPFVQAYEEYKTIASKAKIQASASGALAQGAGGRIWSKDVARDVWAELATMGLIMEDGSRGGRVDVGLEEIGMSAVELGSWGRWCREI